MYRHSALVIVLCLARSIVTASVPVTTQSGFLTILLENFQIPAREKLHLERSGSLSPEAVETWKFFSLSLEGAQILGCQRVPSAFIPQNLKSDHGISWRASNNEPRL